MQEMQVQSLDQEDTLEKEIASHSTVLAWEIPWTDIPWAGKRARQDLAAKQQQQQQQWQ